MRRLFLFGAMTVLSGFAASAQDAGDAIRPITLLTQPQAAAPQEYQAAQIIADAWRKLGLTVNVRPLPGQQYNQVIWYERQRWDATTWQMVGRPERSDPDELTYNLFVSANAANGYDFVGYNNPAFDKLAQQQREELDIDKRRALIMQAQELINHDQPYGFEVHPKNVVAYNKTVWDPKSLVSQAGIGIRNTWTWLSISPLGTQKDVVLNSVAPPTNLNPFNIPGGQGSWATEIVWDRLMRVGPDGLPQPWAAEKVERPDTLTVNVTLRKGMKWSDGKPVTIDDAVFSLEAPGYADKAPMYKPFVQNIASVETTGPDTLSIKLKRPDAAFLVSSLSKLNLAPKHVWAPIFEDLKNKPQTAESIQEEHPVSSGPFHIVRANLNQEIVLEANPDHWSHPEDQSLDHAHHAQRRGIGGRAEKRRDQLPGRLYRRSAAPARPRQIAAEHRGLRGAGHRLQVHRVQRASSAVRQPRVPAGDLGGHRPASCWPRMPGAARPSPPIRGSRRRSASGMPRGWWIACPEATRRRHSRSSRTRASCWSATSLHYPKGVKETTAPFQ